MSAAVIQALAVTGFTAIVFVIRVRTGHPPRWLRKLNQGNARGAPRRPPSRIVPIRAWFDVIVLGVVPWLIYLILRQSLGSDTSALALATAVPAVWVGIRWVLIRRIDRVGLVVIVAYGCALALSAALGNAATPLKLRDAGALAAVGLACLISVLLRRPLLWLGLRYLARHRRDDEQSNSRIEDPQRRRDLASATMLAGALFLLATLTEVLLMIGASTATFLAIAGPLGGLTPLAALAVAVAFLRHRTQRQQHQGG